MKIDKRNNLTTRLSYIAGFIDGEGCIRIKKANKTGDSYYITLQVTNTDKTPLDLIQSIFGGKVYSQGRGVNKKVWQYYITCSGAVDVLKTLEGFFLCKKQQAIIAIYFHDHKETLNNDDKLWYYNAMRFLKNRKPIGDIYENPEILKV